MGVGPFDEPSVHSPDRAGEPEAGVEGHYLRREYPRFRAERAHDVEKDPGVQPFETFGQALGGRVRFGAHGRAAPAVRPLAGAATAVRLRSGAAPAVVVGGWTGGSARPLRIDR